jgi:hypothetical protein
MRAGMWGRSLVSNNIVSDVESRLHLPPQPGSKAEGSSGGNSSSGGGLYSPPLEEGDAVEVRTSSAVHACGSVCVCIEV